MKKTFKSVIAVLFCVLMLSATILTAAALDAPVMKVKSVTHNSVTLYWTKVSKADGYQIQRSTDGKNWTTLSSAVTATTYKDSKSLTAGKSYAYRIRSYDKGLFKTTYSSWTAKVTAKPVPAKVTGLKVSSATNTSVKLTWTKISGVSGYTVQLYSGGKWKNYKNVTTNSLNVTGLKLGTNYYFRVAAYKTVSSKKVYGAVSATLKTTPVLAATNKVVLTNVTTSSLKLQWNSVAGAKGYKVYNHSTKKWLNADKNTTLNISSLSAGTSYSFTVRAYAGSVNGKNSSKYTFTTKPTAPKGLKIVDATDSSISVTWNTTKGAVGYQASYRVAGGSWKNLSTTAGTSATITGLASLTNYEIKVRAYATNKNVSGIIANAVSSWSSVVKKSTALAAPVPTVVKASNTTDTSFKWTAVAGAAGYTVEKYDTFYQKWYVYDFESNSWKAPENIPESANIATTKLSFKESGLETRGEVYRVRALEANGNKGTASQAVTSLTKGVTLNTTGTLYTVQQTFTWPAIEGAVSYQIIKRSPLTNYDVFAEFDASAVDQGNGTCKTYIYLAPESSHSIMVLAKDAQDKTHTATNWVTLSIGQVPADYLVSGNKYYNAAINSQLQYLAQAINNTKAYKDTLTVKNNSQIAYDINYLKLPPVLSIFLGGPANGVCDTPEKIAKLFSKMDDTGEMQTSASETYNSTVIFENGTGLTEDNKTVRLKTFVEPSSNSTGTAYLYDGQNYKAWKNGFSSVSVKKNTDGSTTMTLKFKKESMDSKYHNGFMSSFSADAFGAGSGFSVKSLTVGASTLTATIDKDGILTSYVAESPYSAKFAASFTADEDIKDDGVNIEAGSNITMEMGIAGKTNYNFTFIR